MTYALLMWLAFLVGFLVGCGWAGRPHDAYDCE
jgi:hypothetical protein